MVSGGDSDVLLSIFETAWFLADIVTFYNQAKVAGRVCTGIEVKHPEKRPPFDFYLARVFIDDELSIPVRYAAWSWPNASNESPQLIEEYTYTNVKINQNLTDADFDPERIAEKRSLLNKKPGLKADDNKRQQQE